MIEKIIELKAHYDNNHPIAIICDYLIKVYNENNISIEEENEMEENIVYHPEN